MNIALIIIWSAFAGISFASVYAYYVKHIIGAFIRALISEECFSGTAAKSLSELKDVNIFLLRFSLRARSSLHETVSTADGNRYYIEPSKVVKAKRRYKGDIKLFHVFLSVAVFFVVALVMAVYYDEVSAFAAKIYKTLRGE